MNALLRKLGKVSLAPKQELWWLLEAVTETRKHAILRKAHLESKNLATFEWLSHEQKRRLDTLIFQRTEGQNDHARVAKKR